MDTNQSSETASSYVKNEVAQSMAKRWGVTPHQAIEILLASTPERAMKLHWLYTNEGKFSEKHRHLTLGSGRSTLRRSNQTD
ncbi:MAG: hypothetical protein [Microviridae sp.]|nr:MAG: hypothetical protein [Microviridae sp.]